MNYLQYKLLICQEIPKHTLLLLMSETSLTDDELKLKLSNALKLLINQESTSIYKLVAQAIEVFYVIINEYSESSYINKGKVAKSVKFTTTDTSSFTEYLANLKFSISKRIKILQEIFVEHIARVIRTDSIKVDIDDDAITYEQFLLLIKEPIKFNITESSSSSATLNLIMIDKALPLLIIQYSESDGSVQYKLSNGRKFKIDRISKSKYNTQSILAQYVLLEEYDNLDWKQIDELKLTTSYRKEI